MKLLIDGDILVFRAGFAAEKNHWFLSVRGEEPEQFAYKRDATKRLDELLPHRTRDGDYKLWSERYLEPLENALGNLKGTVRKIQEDCACSDFETTVYLSGTGNFREKVAVTKPYKGNRDSDHRPTYEQEIRSFIKSSWDTEVSDGEEADDLLGIAQCSIGPLDSVIATADKDLYMIPGLKYNVLSQEKLLIDEDTAMSNFYHQLLVGDSTDNIPGIPKVGKVKAHNLLDPLNLEEKWQAVVQMYMSKGGENWEDYLVEQGRLLWIRRQPGELWTPELDVDPLDDTELTLEVG